MSKLFNFTEKHFLLICKHRIPLDCLFIIELIKNGVDVNNEEYMAFVQRLQRKGYLDMNMKLSSYGEELYQKMFETTEEPAVLVKKRVKVEGDRFEDWWAVYPSTNFFEYEGREFKGTQHKRIHKEQCRKLFTAMCASKFTAEEIIQATQYHIKTAMEISLKKRENQLTYIPNSERYLREQYFEPYITISQKAGKQSFTEGKDLTIEI